MAEGEGWVAGGTDKDKGAEVGGKGTKGTMNNAGWGK